MADIELSFSFPGVEGGERATEMLGNLGKALTSAKGSGESLKQLRQLFEGLKGKASVVEELRTAIQGLNNAAAGLSTSFTKDINQLKNALRSEFNLLREVIKTHSAGLATEGAKMGKALAASTAEGIKDGEVQVEKAAKSLAARAKLAATKAYEEVFKSQGGMIAPGELFKFKEQGATLTPYHSALLKNWEKSSNETYRRLKSIQSAQLKEATESEAARYEATLKKMAADQSAADASYAALRKDSLARGKTLILSAAKDMLALQNAQLKTEAEAEAARYEATLKKMAADQAAADARYAALRKDSLTRGRAAILGAAKGNLKYAPESVVDGSGAALAMPAQKLDPKPIEAHAKALRNWGIDARDTYSAARGLASGFNMLWLTWGNLLPLLAGSAVSFGFRKVIEDGAQVNHTLQTLQVLAGASAQQISSLNSQMMKLSENGPFGPLEVAKAMKTLALAGLDATEVASALPDVLNFSIAGDTTIEKAADVLTSVASAFNLTSNSYNYAADVIAKSAAVSKASIEDMGEAFKTASVVHKQYGASLEDVGLGLALLANLGIKGSAAGTALRNTYVDLSGRSKEAAAAMDKLGIKLKDQNGRFKDLVSMTIELNKGLDKLRTEGEKRQAVDLIAGERGAKLIVEARDMAKARVEIINGVKATTREVNAELLKMQAEISQSAGFAAISAAKLSMTPLNEMKSVASALQAALVSAFTGMESEISKVSSRLREIFASEDFRAQIRGIASAVASVTVAIAEHLPMLIRMLELYAAFKVLQIGGAIVTSAANFVQMGAAAAQAGMGLAGVQKGLAGVIGYGGLLSASQATKSLQDMGMVAKSTATATEGLAVASGAAAVASTRLGTALAFTARWLPGIGIALQAVAGAFALYEIFGNKAVKTTEDLGNLDKVKAYIEKLEEQTARIKEQNEALALNISLEELRRRKQAAEVSKAVESGTSGLQSQLDQNRLKAESAKRSGANSIAQRLDREADNLRTKISDYNKYAMRAADKAAEAEEEVIKHSAKTAELAKKGQQAIYDVNAKGINFDGLKAPTATGRLPKDNEISDLKARLSDQESALKDSYDYRRKLLDMNHSNLLMSDGEYMVQSITMAEGYEKERIALALSTSEKLKKAYADRIAELSKIKTPQAAQEIENLQRSRSTDEARIANEIAKIKEEASYREAKAAGELQKRIKDLTKSTDDYFKSAERDIKKDSAIYAESRQWENINTSITSADIARKAYAEGYTAELEKHTGQIEKMQTELAKHKTALADVEDAMFSEALAIGTVSKGLDDEATRLRAVNDELERNINLRKGQAVELAKRRGDLEAQKAKDKQIDEFARGIAGAMETAVFEGGAAGGRSLRKFLEEELMRKPFRMEIVAFVKSLVGGKDGGKGEGGTLSSMFKNFFGDSKESGGGFSGMLSKFFGEDSAITKGFGELSTAFSSFKTEALAGFKDAFGLSNPAAGTAGSFGPTSMAFKAGGYAASAVGAYAGYKLNKSVSNGYEISKGMTTLQNLSTVVASFMFGPLVGALSGIASGIQNRLWGRKTTETGIRGTFGGDQGFVGYNYTFQKGGYFRSNKTTTSALAEETRSAFAETFKDVKAQTKEMASALGLATESIDSFSKNISLNLMGLNSEQAVKAITAMFEDIQNDMAKGLLGTSEQGKMLFTKTDVWKPGGFVRDGEKAIDALKRMYTGLVTVNAALSNFGMKLLESSLVGGDIGSKVLDSFGGVDKFNEAVGAYYSAFYSENEIRTNALGTLDKAFAKLGKTTPANIEQFRALVEAQDLSTEAGRDLFKSLMELAPAFAQAKAATTELANARAQLEIDLLTAQGKTAEAEAATRAAAIKGLTAAEIAAYDYNVALKKQIDALQTTTKLSEDKAQLEIDLLKAQGKTAEAEAATRARDIKGYTDAQIAAYDYNAALKKQVELMQLASSTVLAEIDRLRGKLSEGSTSNLATLQARFATETAAARAGDKTALEKLPGLSQAIEEAAAATATTALDVARLRGWLVRSLADTMKALNIDVPAFATGGDHFGGWRLVGDNGPELEATGPSRIYNAKQTQAILRGTGSSDKNEKLVEKVSQMIEQIQYLRAETRSSAVATTKIARILNNVSQNGDSLSVVTNDGDSVSTKAA